MTSPDPWAGISTADEQDALHQIGRMMVGTKMLQTEPGIVYSLAAQQAHPADAQAIDQFLQSLDAEKQVAVARATGEPIHLSAEQQSLLKATGTSYADVLWTPKTGADAAAQRVLQASGGDMTVQRNEDGSLALDKNGQIQVQKVHKDTGGSWLGDVGGFFEHIGHDAKNWVWNDALDKGLQGVQKGYNFVATGVEQDITGAAHGAEGIGAPSDPTVAGATESSLAQNTHAEDMQAQGYDPNSFWSTMAFQASGKAHSNLGGLVGKYGQDRVDEALRFLNDPKQYRDQIVSDPASYIKNADGHTSLTPEATAKVNFLNSKDFTSLARQVNAHQATIGNDLANALGIDPVNHPDWYNSTAAVTNLAAAFALDPTNAALGGLKVAKLTQIGIDSLGDSASAAKVLTSSGHWAKQVQRGWQQAIDLGAQMRDAKAAGDEVQLAKLTAQFHASLPDLAPMMPEFVGEHAVTGYRDATEAERAATGAKYAPVYEHTGGIKSLDEAAQFVESNVGLSLLRSGTAVRQGGYMPGALSAVGYRRLKGIVSGVMTSRSAQRAADAAAELVSRAEADPLLAKKLLDSDYLVKSMPKADDAVTVHSDRVIAYKPADSSATALGNLMGLMREGQPAMSERAALADELDSLESRAQQLMADKGSTPEDLASVHDAIATGRQLLNQADEALVPSLKQIKDAQKALHSAEAQLSVTVPGEAKAASSIGLRVERTSTTLPSAQRAEKLAITPAGRGMVARNLRASGDVLGKEFDDAASKFGYFSPTALAARGRLGAQRLSTLLPRNTRFSLDDPETGEKLYKMGMTYLNRGDAQALRAAWNFGDAGQRKAVISGLIDQLAHASGLGSTASGKQVLARMKTSVERYSTIGDEIKLNDEPMALFAGQTRSTWDLPSFQRMQQVSAKLGLWESTLGRPLTSTEADKFMGQWKMGALFKPSTVTRNMLEGWLRTVLEGRVGDSLRARALATARNKELWDRGFGETELKGFQAARGDVEGLDQLLKDGGLGREQRKLAFEKRRAAKQKMTDLEHHPRVQHLLATEAGDTEKAKQLANGSMMHGEVLGRSVTGQRLADFAPMAAVGRAYRSLVGKTMDEETTHALMTLSPHELAESMEGYGQQILAYELGFKGAAQEATEIAKAGFGPSRIRYALHRQQARSAAAAKLESVANAKGAEWTHFATDGTEGADRYAHALSRVVDKNPETARAILDRIEQGSPIDPVVAAFEKEKGLTAHGKVFFENPTADPNMGREAVDSTESALGKRDWAQKQVNELHHLLTGQNDEYQQELADYIRAEGKAPSGEWIAEHIKGDHRPEGVLAPQVMAMPNGGLKGLATALQDVEGAGYQWFVERPLQRTTSSPVFLANYAIERKGLNAQVEKLVDSGMSREAAESFAKDIAIKRSWVKTESMIDDPGQKAQFDVVARNMFPFARATQAMIRRWGEGLWQNPAAARRMMLAYEGAVHSGLIYDNPYGEPSFTYPASGVMNMALRGLSQVPGFENVAAFPVAGDMTGQVLLSVPGADNPFRMSMGPMVSIPFREVYKHLLPTSWQGDLEKFDAAWNGPVGQGQTFEQLTPTVIRHLYQNTMADDRNSALASSMNGAIANLAAAGLLPDPSNTNSAAVMQQFRTRLQTQVQNQLYVRFVFGLFAPAPPSQPSEGVAGEGADYAWNLDGIKNLDDEYKSILNETNGDVGRAMAVFTAMHPDKLVFDPEGGKHFKMPSSAYETARSAATASGAYLPSTEASLKWLTNNADFVKRYGSVSAYFLPAGDASEPFSDAAYKAQIELGLRQRKMPDQFMQDVYVKHAEALYYPSKAEYDRRIELAKSEGNTDLARQLTDSKAQWEKDFKNLNPLLGEKLDQYGPARATALSRVADLRQMLKNGDVPDGLGVKLKQLVTTYDNYEKFVTANPGQDDYHRQARDNALAMLDGWAHTALAGTPLTAVYNGVYRVLNTNLTTIGG